LVADDITEGYEVVHPEESAAEECTTC
jgi:hypothetical protein